jgi:hypothetical protein
VIPDHLRIQPGQQALSPAQEAEARRFADERIHAQLSTGPVDEQEAEACLCQAYQAAGLAPPQRIQWVDGPLQFAAVLAARRVQAIALASVAAGVSIREGIKAIVEDSIWESILASVQASIEASNGIRVWDDIAYRVGESVEFHVRDRLWGPRWESIEDGFSEAIVGMEIDSWECVGAYNDARWLAVPSYFAVYLAPNALHALGRFNELVSGYRLGQEEAVIVRRPRVLSRDEQGRLHSATGKCLEYRDGWGVYAWHGMRVPERVMLSPERLSREDFLSESNVEVRRVIQERMGSRFVSELGGVVLDSSPRGTLYEVKLPDDDPEGAARYVQVQDTSTARQYLLRVPPTIQAADEAVAWSFGLPVKDYHPADET